MVNPDKILLFLAVLIVSFGVSTAAVPVNMTVGGVAEPFTTHGNGAYSADITNNIAPTTDNAYITFDDKTIQQWNGINGAPFAGIPDGFTAGTWHWVYTPSGVLTISHVIGTNDYQPPTPVA